MYQPPTTRGRRSGFVTAGLLAVLLAAFQGAVATRADAPATPGAPATPAAPAVDGLPPIPPPMSAAHIIQLLDQAVDWYRTLGIQQQTANEPSDLLILYDNRQTANKVMVLAFDFARANADLLLKEQPAVSATTGQPGLSTQSLAQLQSKFEAQGRAVQAELDAARRKLPTAGKASRTDLQAKVNELEGELGLIDTKKNIVGTMTQYVTNLDGAHAGSLKAQIDAMAVAVPAATAPGTATGGPTGAPAAGTSAATAPAAVAPPMFAPANSVAGSLAGFGLWDLAANAFRLGQKAETIASIDRRTAALQNALAQISAPLAATLKALSARGDVLGAKADSADSATLNAVRDELDRLAERFKQTSAMLIPLSREDILLSQYRRNLDNWRDIIRTQSREALETLGIRAGVLLLLLALLFGAAELWRRMVLRYIQDTRRRYQLLLLRRIALWSLVFIVIGVSFASQLGSIVTFAGLLTAGIAVAMQSVLVSLVGYFFLIGKYGIRVGDRVQIGDVAGEVIELGLVRMYLLELGAKGTLGPTGRVVAFANSVVFQVASGLFKQIPGVDFSWREVTLPLPPGVDYALVKDKLTAAMTKALSEYRGEILRQTREIERATSSSAGGADPQVQLRFSAAGVEAHVRYPVHLQHAAEIDERVTEALARVMSDALAAPGAGAARQG